MYARQVDRIPSNTDAILRYAFRTRRCHSSRPLTNQGSRYSYILKTAFASETPFTAIWRNKALSSNGEAQFFSSQAFYYLLMFSIPAFHQLHFGGEWIRWGNVKLGNALFWFFTGPFLARCCCSRILILTSWLPPYTIYLRPVCLIASMASSAGVGLVGAEHIYTLSCGAWKLATRAIYLKCNPLLLWQEQSDTECYNCRYY